MTDTPPVPDDVQQLLDSVYPDPQDQSTWLATPSALLTGDTPYARLASDDPAAAQTVEDVLLATDVGVYDAESQLAAPGEPEPAEPAMPGEPGA